MMLGVPAFAACPSVPAPEIAVKAVRQEAQIRQDLSKEQLQALQTDTDLPYQMQDLSHVETGGMMRGDIKVKYAIGLGDIPEMSRDSMDRGCVRYKSISVTLELAPTIFIAREHAPESCWYKQIREHEESHIDMDKLVIDKYVERITDGLKLAFAAPEDNVGGPVAIKKIPALKKTMGENLMKMVDVLVRDMTRERHDKQQAVDSLHGYGYIMNSCYSGDNVLTPSP